MQSEEKAKKRDIQSATEKYADVRYAMLIEGNGSMRSKRSTIDLSCFASERDLREWYGTDKSKKTRTKYELTERQLINQVIERITKRKDITETQREKLRRVVRAHPKAWSYKPGLIKGDPVRLPFVDNYKRVKMPCPTWGVAATKYMKEWADEKIWLGTYYVARNLSEIDFVLRPNPVVERKTRDKTEEQKQREEKSGIEETPEKERMISKVRTTVDSRVMTPLLKTLPNNLSLPFDIKEKFAQFRYLFAVDVPDAYQHVMTDGSVKIGVWTPRGILVTDRLFQGTKGAGSLCQEKIESMFRDIPTWKTKIDAYRDDIYGGSNDFEEFVEIFDAVLSCCERYGAHLRPDKAVIGEPTIQCLGDVVGSGSYVPGDGNVKAIMNAPMPTDVASARSLLGYLGTYRDHVDHYAKEMGPLMDLMKKDTKFPKPLPRKIIESIERVKEVIFAKPCLMAFCKDIPAVLAMDACDIAVGGVFYHVIKGKKHPILFISKKLNETQKKWPIYIKEAWGIIVGVKRVMHYIMCSNHPLKILTDHKPLKFLHHAKSPVVERWVIQYLTEVDWMIEYVKGALHWEADFPSRIPCLSPGVPTDPGNALCLRLLLTAIPVEGQDVIVFTFVPPPVLRPVLAQVRPLSVEFLSTTDKSLMREWKRAIVIPTAERAPLIARKLFKKDLPFAILLPTDLVHYIYTRNDEVDVGMRKKVEGTMKIVFMEDNLVWLCHGLNMDTHKVFYNEPDLKVEEGRNSLTDYVTCEMNSIELFSPVPAPPFRVPLRKNITHEMLRTAQKRDLPEMFQKGEKFEHENGQYELKDDVIMRVLPGRHYVLVLPLCAIRPVLLFMHRNVLEHCGRPRMLSHVRDRYWFPYMEREIDTILDGCHECLLSKARQILNLGNYHPQTYTHIGQGIAMDIWGKTIESDENHIYILSIICLFSSLTMFLPLRKKTSQEVIENFVRYWLLPPNGMGVPEIVLSDQAQTFMSKMIGELVDKLGCEWMYTAPRSSFQLGRLERVHFWLVQWFKMLPKKKKKRWHVLLPTLCDVVNTMVSATSSLSPYQICYGHNPKMPMDQAMSFPSSSPYVNPPSSELLSEYMELRQKLKKLGLETSFEKREKNAERKNKSGTNHLTLREHDIVQIKIEKKEKDIPGKATYQWRAPYVILERRGNNKFLVQYCGDVQTDLHKIYEKGKNEIRPYTAPVLITQTEEKRRVSGRDAVPEEQDQVSEGAPSSPGEVVVTKEEDHYWVCTVIGPGKPNPEEWTEVSYKGIEKKKKISKYAHVYRDVWRDPKDKKLILTDTDPRENKSQKYQKMRVSEKTARWTGMEHVDNVVMRNVILKRGRLEREVIDRLEAMSLKAAMMRGPN
jgi:hypothetical protein